MRGRRSVMARCPERRRCCSIPSPAAIPSLAPEGAATATVTLGAIPYRLFDGGWSQEKRTALAAHALARIEKALPGTLANLTAVKIIAPPDMESALAATAGDLDGGALAPDQMLALRPGPRTELPGFYLGGRSAQAGPLGHRRGGFCRGGRSDGGWRGMSERAAALVIGAGVGGLSAAAFLARGGRHTLLLEAGKAPREPDEALIALDPRMVAELRLPALGLTFAARDLPLAVAGDMPLLLGRDLYAASSALAKFSDADALAWPTYRRRLTAEARRLRRWWWTAPDRGAPDAAWSAGARRGFHRLCFSGADAYLGARFETPSLLAALLWDAGAGGFSVSEPGSALALVWRAAQEMAGLQEAAAIAHPGTLVASLMRALGMAQLRTDARVTRILTKAGGVTGVVLADGSEIEADHIVSTLSRAQTLTMAGLPQVPSDHRRSQNSSAPRSRVSPCRMRRPRVTSWRRGRICMPTRMKRRGPEKSRPNCRWNG